MNAQDLTKLAQECMQGAIPREGPATPEQAVALASAYAQIAIAQELTRLRMTIDWLLCEPGDDGQQALRVLIHSAQAQE